jgi:hypothetical protein
MTWLISAAVRLMVLLVKRGFAGVGDKVEVG